MVLTLTKTEQLILIEMFKNYRNKFILDKSKIDISNSRLYDCLKHLSHVGLIEIKCSKKSKREKIYQLTDLGIIFTSNISELDNPKVFFELIVKYV